MLDASKKNARPRWESLLPLRKAGRVAGGLDLSWDYAFFFPPRKMPRGMRVGRFGSTRRYFVELVLGCIGTDFASTY